MAFEDIELEIKVKVDESTFQTVIAQIEGLATYLGSERQIDRYLQPLDMEYTNQKFPFKWLSIRSRDGKHTVNYKHFFPEGAEKHSHCTEYTVDISEPDIMSKLLEELGFTSLVTVEKTRHSYQYKDEFEIAFDSVSGLGLFIEIEATKDLGGIAVTRDKLEHFARSLNIDLKMTDLRGYPYRLIEQQGLSENV